MQHHAVLFAVFVSNLSKMMQRERVISILSLAKQKYHSCQLAISPTKPSKKAFHEKRSIKQVYFTLTIPSGL